MGFFDKIRKIGKSVWEGAKTVATKTVEYTAKATKFVGETLVDVADAISNAISSLGKKSTPPPIDYPPIDYPTGGTSTGPTENGGNSYPSNEEIEKERIRKEAEAISKYQSKVATNAKEREDEVKKVYLNIYSKYIKDFSEVLDEDLIKDIKDNIKKASKTFKNTMRDEVNTRVSPSYKPWKQLISNHPTDQTIQDYCDRVYKEADNNLMDLLQSSIENTNKFISKCIIKYNEDKAKALAEMKESLVKLTSDEETKAQELKKIAEELAVAQFIANETTIEI